MVVQIAVIASIVVVAYVLYEKYGKVELGKLLAELEGLVAKLEEFKASKELQIANHFEEIALHQSHVNAKKADVERATRIRDRLNELLS